MRAGVEGAQLEDASGDRELVRADEAMRSSDVDGAVAHLSAAIRRFTAGGDPRRAALTCVQLGRLFAITVGNLTAARAWFLRATRLLEHEPPCVEQGWVAVAAVGCDVDDPAMLLAGAELALDRARRFGDVNLETKALADAGLAHVQSGRLAEGMALLDEAMALVCGPADDEEAAGQSVCSFFTACYYAADFERAGSWAPILRRAGWFGPAAGPAAYLSNHCDAVQATLLCELGRWSDAEALLLRAMQEFESCMRLPSWHPAIALAELRIRQGRLADAEALLLGKDGHLQALLPSARLHLARGDLDLARAMARRGLRAIKGDRLRAAELLVLVVDVELAAGDWEAAAAASAEVVARADRLELPGLRARVASARARVLAAAGELTAAVQTVEAALDSLPQDGLPLSEATLLLDLVRFHERLGNRAAATVEAGRAAAALADLDVVLEAGDLALLDRFGAPATGRPPAHRTAALCRHGAGWVVSCDDTSARLGDTKGLRHLAVLVATPGRERHCLDLVDLVEKVGGDGGPDRRQLGDAGDLADSRARTAYRRRVEQLRSEIDEALEVGAEERAYALHGELDQLVAELARAFGLGGRGRRASSAAERARLNVTRALRAATARICEALPEPGGALDRRLRTGLYCAYEPQEGDEIRWIVQS